MKEKLQLITLLVLTILLVSCSSSESENENYDTFITLHERIEEGNVALKNSSENVYGIFEYTLASYYAIGESNFEVNHVKNLQEKAMMIKQWSKSMSNYTIEQSSEMIKFAEDESFGIKQNGETANSNHFEEDNEGCFNLFPLNHLNKKGDFDVPTFLFIGDNIETPRGLYIIDSILDYRDRVCMLIANYKDENGMSWSFIPPDFLSNKEGSLKSFEEELNNALYTANPKDTAIIKEIFRILTPLQTFNGDEYDAWFVKQFHKTPLVGAITMFTKLRSDILQVEMIAAKHIVSRIERPLYEFNKIDIIATSSSSFVKKDESLKLTVVIDAYDSTEVTKIVYWVDDSTKTGEGVSVFFSKNNFELPSDKIGKHTLYGNIAVKEKGVEKWKPWKYEYTVGK